MNTITIIGTNIKNLRRNLGISQEKLANEALISTTHLRNLEHGKGNPTINTLEKIAECLSVDLITLLLNPESTDIFRK